MRERRELSFDRRSSISSHFGSPADCWQQSSLKLANVFRTQRPSLCPTNPKNPNSFADDRVNHTEHIGAFAKEIMVQDATASAVLGGQWTPLRIMFQRLQRRQQYIIFCRELPRSELLLNQLTDGWRKLVLWHIHVLAFYQNDNTLASNFHTTFLAHISVLRRQSSWHALFP